jgi:hypothetical protein
MNTILPCDETGLLTSDNMQPATVIKDFKRLALDCCKRGFVIFRQIDSAKNEINKTAAKKLKTSFL